MIMALVIGAVTYYFDKLSIPPVPIVLAFIMRPIIELNMNRAMTIHQGDIMVVVTSPISMTILLASLATIYFGIRRTSMERLVGKD